MMDTLQDHFLLVTPARNEIKNLSELATCLKEIVMPRYFKWVIVVNNSKENFPAEIMELLGKDICEILIYPGREKGLTSGVAFKAWKYGVEKNQNQPRYFDYVMKLDADVRLAKDYFVTLQEHDSGADLIGGVTNSIGSREQKVHIQGCVKLYSRKGFEIVSKLPTELGFDVMDELELRSSGRTVQVVRQAQYELTRQTHTSEGHKQGMLRNGKMCNWVGYSKTYFILHLFRALQRKPYIISSLYVVVGYLTAGPSPYSDYLKELCRKSQKTKIKNLLLHPYKWILDAYY
jgi:glycosyltransferase involved in cell wall biosynthesis